MTLLSAILCRIGGHKPYEHPHIVWAYSQLHGHTHGTAVMVKRCKRCGSKLGQRPMLAYEDEPGIEA